MEGHTSSGLERKAGTTSIEDVDSIANSCCLALYSIEHLQKHACAIVAAILCAHARTVTACKHHRETLYGSGRVMIMKPAGLTQCFNYHCYIVFCLVT